MRHPRTHANDFIVERTNTRFQEWAPYRDAARPAKLFGSKAIFPPPRICPNHNKKAGHLASLKALLSGLRCCSGGNCFRASFFTFLDMLNENEQSPHSGRLRADASSMIGASVSAFAKFIK